MGVREGWREGAESLARPGPGRGSKAGPGGWSRDVLCDGDWTLGLSVRKQDEEWGDETMKPASQPELTLHVELV